MKTILYILTAIMISGILFSAIPVKQNNKNVCISLKCTDAKISEALMKESANIIESRLRDIGYKPSQVTIAEEGLIEICFKKENDLIKVSHLLTSKGKFEFYETIDRNNVLKSLKKDDKLFSALNIPEAKNEKMKISNSVLGYYENTVSESSAFLESLNNTFNEKIKFALSKYEGKEKNMSLYILKPSAFLDGNSISDIRSGKDKKTGAYYISMNFNDEASKKWAEITRNNIGKEIAMVLDDQVYSAPLVMGEIKGGKSMITGNFSKFETSVLSALIKNGELSLEFEIIK